MANARILSMFIAALKSSHAYEEFAAGAGGSRGLALIGAFRALEKLKILKNIKKISATSIGALMVLGPAVGLSADSMSERTKNKIRDKSILQFKDHSGQHIENEAIDMIMAKENKLPQAYRHKDFTFKQLHELKEKYPELHLKDLYITALEVTNGEVREVTFSHETMPDMPIRIAIHASMAAPYFYAPVEYQGKIYIDGCLTRDLPIRELDKRDENGKWTLEGTNPKTFGISLTSQKPKPPKEPDTHKNVEAKSHNKNKESALQDALSLSFRELKKPVRLFKDFLKQMKELKKQIKLLPLKPFIVQDEIHKASFDPLRTFSLEANAFPLFDFNKITEDLFTKMDDHGYRKTMETFYRKDLKVLLLLHSLIYPRAQVKDKYLRFFSDLKTANAPAPAESKSKEYEASREQTKRFA